MAKFDQIDRMGIIAKQATRNLGFIGIGFLLGATNTLIVLPNAFEDFSEGWGVLRLIIAAFMILSQIFSFGATNIIIKFFNAYGENKGRLLRFALFTSLAGIAGLTALIYLVGESMSHFFFPEEGHLLVPHLGLVALISAAYIIFLMFQGYVNAILKSTFHQFLNETFLKGYYLGIAALFLFGFLSFDQLLVAFAIGYILAAIILAVYSVTQGFTLSGSGGNIDRKELLIYGGYSVLDKGAQTIVNHLDVVMIAMLVTVEDVGFYALAAYIGTVTQMPQRAIQVIASPLVSKALAEDDQGSLRSVYIKSCRDQLILGGLIFVAVWVSIDELLGMMPGKFGSGKWVVFLIGLSKLCYMASGVSGGIIIYSKYFRTNLWLNLSLIVLTIATNYFFMSPDYLNMGFEGAALATAITFFIYNLSKLIYIRGKFGINPITKTFGIIAVLIAATSMIHMLTIDVSAWLSIPLKSASAMALLGGVIYFLKLSPDINAQLQRILGKTPTA